MCTRTSRRFQVDERQVLSFGIVQVDQGSGSLGLSTYWVQPARHPTAQGSLGHAQAVGRFSHGVGWQQTGVISCLQGHLFLSNIIGPSCLQVHCTRLSIAISGNPYVNIPPANRGAGRDRILADIPGQRKDAATKGGMAGRRPAPRLASRVR